MRQRQILLPKQTSRFCQLCWITHRHAEPDIIREWPARGCGGPAPTSSAARALEPPSDRRRGPVGRVEPARRADHPTVADLGYVGLDGIDSVPLEKRPSMLKAIIGLLFFAA